jgi:hypothetical protein
MKKEAIFSQIILIFVLFACNSAKKELISENPQKGNSIVLNPTERNPADDFEGTIIYEYDYFPKDEAYDKQEMAEQFGQHATTYFKNGFYKEVSDAVIMDYQLFRNDDSAYYFQNGGSKDTLWKMNVGMVENQEFSYEIQKNADTIMGYQCDALKVKDQYGTKTYYYNRTIATDPKQYANFKGSNKNKIVAIMESLYLKLEMEYDLYTVKVVAKKVERMPLDEETFQLPAYEVLKNF